MDSTLIHSNVDITAIVALREFLMSGIGGRILEVLLTIDTKVKYTYSSFKVNLFNCLL